MVSLPFPFFPLFHFPFSYTHFIPLNAYEFGSMSTTSAHYCLGMAPGYGD